MNAEKEIHHDWMWTSGFCQRLRTAREKAGLSQTDAAFMLKTNQSTICRYESAVKCPTAFRVVELAQLYGCTVSYLFGEGEYERIS